MAMRRTHTHTYRKVSTDSEKLNTNGRNDVRKALSPSMLYRYIIYITFRPVYIVNGIVKWYVCSFLFAGAASAASRVIEYLSIRRFAFGWAFLWLSPINFTRHVNAQYPMSICLYAWLLGACVGRRSRSEWSCFRQNQIVKITTTTAANASLVERRTYNKY